MPFAIEEKLIGGGIRPQDAKFFTSNTDHTNVLLGINEEVNDVLFVAKTLLNSFKPEDYNKVNNIGAFADVFGKYKKEKITSALLQHAVDEMLVNAQFDYQKYFARNSLSEDKIQEAVLSAIKENSAIAEDIRNGNQGKAGVLVGKVISKIGKGASGKVIRNQILAELAPSDNSKKTSKNYSAESTVTRKVLKEGEVPKSFKAIVVEDDYRTHVNANLDDGNIAEEVKLAGWVSSLRDHGDLVFIDFRDSSYEILQVRMSKDAFPNLDDLARLKPESVIMVEGKIIRREKDDFNPGIRTGKIELDATNVQVLNLAQTLPFEINVLEKRMKTFVLSINT